jgi:hypothetical protein
VRVNVEALTRQESRPSIRVTWRFGKGWQTMIMSPERRRDMDILRANLDFWSNLLAEENASDLFSGGEILKVLTRDIEGWKWALDHLTAYCPSPQ